MTKAIGAQWQVSTAGGIAAAWRRDGKELYYLNPTDASSQHRAGRGVRADHTAAELAA